MCLDRKDVEVWSKRKRYDAGGYIQGLGRLDVRLFVGRKSM